MNLETCQKQYWQSAYIWVRDVLPGLEFAEFTAFEEDLERRPDEGRCCLRTVDCVVPEGEACADGLVDVDHCIKVGVQKSRILV